MQLVRMVVLANHMPVFVCLNPPEIIRERPELGFRAGIERDACGDTTSVIPRDFVTIFCKPVQPIIGCARYRVPIESGRATFVGGVDPINR